MDESSAEITTTFLGLFTERGDTTESMILRLYGNQNNWGISIEVSFVERKKDETTLLKQAKILISQWLLESIIGFRKNDEKL